MSTKEKLIRNTAYSGLTSGISGIVGFLIIPFIVAKVGLEEYGLIGICNLFSVNGYVSLIEMGFQASISKFTSQHLTKGEHVEICRLITSALAVFLGIAVILSLIGFGLSGLMSHKLFPVPDAYRSSFRNMLLVVFASYIYQLPAVVFAGFFEGLQRFDIARGIQMLGTVCHAGAVFLLLIFGWDYQSVVIASALAGLMQFILYIVLAYRVRFFSIRYAYLSLSSLREIWTISKYVAIGKVANFISRIAPKTIAAVFLGPISVGTFEILMKLPSFIKVSLGFLNSAIVPAASELDAQPSGDKLAKLFRKGMQYQMIASFPIIIGAMFLSKDFLILWMGPEYGRLYTFLQFLLIWNILNVFINVGGSILVGINRALERTTLLNVVSTCATLLISLLLVRKYELRAVLWGFVFGLAVTCPSFMLIYLKELKIKTSSFLKQVVSITCVAAAPILAIVGLDSVIESVTMLALLLKGTVWCILYWGILYLFFFEQEDRRNLIRAVLFLKLN